MPLLLASTAACYNASIYCWLLCTEGIPWQVVIYDHHAACVHPPSFLVEQIASSWTTLFKINKGTGMVAMSKMTAPGCDVSFSLSSVLLAVSVDSAPKVVKYHYYDNHKTRNAIVLAPQSQHIQQNTNTANINNLMSTQSWHANHHCSIKNNFHSSINMIFIVTSIWFLFLCQHNYPSYSDVIFLVMLMWFAQLHSFDFL